MKNVTFKSGNIYLLSKVFFDFTTKILIKTDPELLEPNACLWGAYSMLAQSKEGRKHLQDKLNITPNSVQNSLKETHGLEQLFKIQLVSRLVATTEKNPDFKFDNEMILEILGKFINSH